MMADRVLIVEDEDNVRLILEQTLIQANYEVQGVGTVREAIAHVQARCYDALVLDLAVGTEYGMEVARVARTRCPYTAIIVLTGHGSLESAIEAVDLRAQAYLLKPTSPDNLIATVHNNIAIMRDIGKRDQLASTMQSAIQLVTRHEPSGDDRLTSGPCCLNLRQRSFTLHGNPIDLTAAEFDMLALLIQHRGLTVTAQHLAHHALGYDITDTEAASLVRSHIARIRTKIESDPHRPHYLITLRGQGYRWIGE